jgi:hypothetical protein
LGNLTTSIERTQVRARRFDGSRQWQFQFHIDLSQGDKPLFFSQVDQWTFHFFLLFAAAAHMVHKKPTAGLQRWVFSKNLYLFYFFELLPHRSLSASQRSATEMRHIVTETHLR